MAYEHTAYNIALFVITYNEANTVTNKKRFEHDLFSINNESLVVEISTGYVGIIKHVQVVLLQVLQYEENPLII